MNKEKFIELVESEDSIVESTEGSHLKGSIYRSVVLTVGNEHWMMTERSDDWDCEYVEDEPFLVRPIEVVKKRWVKVK